MTVAVIDGQGGGIGRGLITAIKDRFGSRVHVLALGTNATATANMVKAGADEGATGERPIVVNAAVVDIIVGVVGIVMADALLGELTPAMAMAVAQSRAAKLLLPQNRCGVTVVGVPAVRLQNQIEQTINEIEKMIGE